MTDLKDLDDLAELDRRAQADWQPAIERVAAQRIASDRAEIARLLGKWQPGDATNPSIDRRAFEADMEMLHRHAVRQRVAAERTSGLDFMAAVELAAAEVGARTVPSARAVIWVDAQIDIRPYDGPGPLGNINKLVEDGYRIVAVFPLADGCTNTARFVLVRKEAMA